ncbi:MAG: hypothetical protein FWG35_02465 [Spirochaetaceae bacterium]|nr:hypothetical protein [Spirochaetaceae bacterium]
MPSFQCLDTGIHKRKAIGSDKIQGIDRSKFVRLRLEDQRSPPALAPAIF